MKLKGIPARYIKNKYTFFFHKVAYKRIMFTNSYLMVHVQIAKYARSKTKIRDALISKRQSAETKVLLSL